MPDIFIFFSAFLIGLCFGSFANVVIYRLPKGLSISKPPSACPSCKKQLQAIDLVPVLSWFFLRGKCRRCKKKISVRYPLVELLCGMLFASMAYASMVNGSPTLSLVPLSVFVFVLLVVSFIDADTQEIPDGLLIIGAVAGIIFIACGHFMSEIFPHARDWKDALLGVIAGAAPLLIIDRLCLLIVKKDGFGYGDVKLMAMVGLFLGWQNVLMAFLFAFVSGAVFAVYLMVTGKAKRGSYFAFGPFLCIGTYLAFFFGKAVLDWYVAFITMPV
ncbi:MAG: prepilin peptidase [Clostridiales bacterium]|jgi:leader peptidase (prepilin peptidase)/N-methyltransferase|nr:prepilin peptidase [Clostridiales bacterium]